MAWYGGCGSVSKGKGKCNNHRAYFKLDFTNWYFLDLY